MTARELKTIAEDEDFDVVVIGAGAAGMEAALFAAIEGAKVLLVERTGVLGGTGALSGGANWIPNSMHAASVNTDDSLANAARYLDLTVGPHSDALLRSTFLREGKEAVAVLESHSDVKFRARQFNPDYFSETEGATMCGRPIEPLPFDGRKLGGAFSLIRAPIPEFTVLGGMMVDRDDISNLLGMMRSFKSFRHSLRIVFRHAMDRLAGWPRGTRLVMGNALIARLLSSLIQRKVSIVVNVDVTALRQGSGGVNGVRLVQSGLVRTVGARGGVILASGGFNRHPTRRAEMFPGVESEWCPMAPGNTGVAQDLALRLGARFGTSAATHGVWAPVSLRKRPDGSVAVFPHFILDRGKPGMLVVDQRGRRFVNESASYQQFGIAMLKANAASPTIPAFLLTDSAGLRRYGLGMIRPGARRLSAYLADGYLIVATSLDDLAGKLGMDAAILEDTVSRINRYAEEGVDPDFQRGETRFERANGDATWSGQNPTLGPIRRPPFYAVRLYLGDIAAATGLEVDEHARVLGQDKPIAGLYAIGGDMQSIMGGVYPGGGITLGPGLVFAYLAARHACAWKGSGFGLVGTKSLGATAEYWPEAQGL